MIHDEYEMTLMLSHVIGALSVCTWKDCVVRVCEFLVAPVLFVYSFSCCHYIRFFFEALDEEMMMICL